MPVWNEKTREHSKNPESWIKAHVSNWYSQYEDWNGNNLENKKKENHISSLIAFISEFCCNI